MAISVLFIFGFRFRVLIRIIELELPRFSEVKKIGKEFIIFLAYRARVIKESVLIHLEPAGQFEFFVVNKSSAV